MHKRWAVLLLVACGSCYRSTGFCQDNSDCNAGLFCNVATNQCGGPVGVRVTPDDSAVADSFGYAVAAAGDTAIVGSANRDQNRGAAYALIRNGATWTQQARLQPSAPEMLLAGDSYGVSVAISGDTAVIGAHTKDATKGAAYVFARTGSGWTYQTRLVPTDGIAGDLFGIAVAVAGDLAMVGAYNKDAAKGAAYIFARVGGGSVWAQQARLMPPDALAVADYFGGAVTISGETAAVAAAGKDQQRGVVYVFARVAGTAAWSAQAKLVAPDAVSKDSFGSALSLSGDTLGIGAAGKNQTQGVAYVFVRVNGTWTQQAELLPPGGGPRDSFGSAVSLAGDTLLVGASRQDRAYVFTRDAMNGWSLRATLEAPDAARASFGAAVATTGIWHLVGVRGLVEEPGAVYAFTF